MNTKVSIFVGVFLVSFCHSARAMCRYTKKLSSARSVRTALCRKRSALLIHPPALFIHALVQAAQTTKRTAALKEYTKEVWPDEVARPDAAWIGAGNSKRFYSHVVSHLPWNGEHEKGAYPLLLNGQEVTIQALCYQSKCINSTYFTEVIAMDDDYWKDTAHHEKICQEFKKLMHDGYDDRVFIGTNTMY